MEQYYFLFALAFVWLIFAIVQDFRRTEIANWLNFSLVAFALAYRGFYALVLDNSSFFFDGLIGWVIFIAVANLFYYAGAFGGGDAKLLMSFGAILPFESGLDYLSIGGTFLLFLFLGGAFYTLVYSSFLVYKKRDIFPREFMKTFSSKRIILLLFVILGIVFSFIFDYWIILLFLILCFIYVYSLSLDKVMIEKVHYGKLMEGDWLVKSVKVGNKVVKKSVHGLSYEDIKLLRKYKKSVLIKKGIPFSPAFLIALVFMVLFYLSLLDLGPYFRF